MPRIRSTLLSIFLLLTVWIPGAHAEYAFFDSDGVRIRYLDVGAGPPVVLIHGFTRSIERWEATGILQDLSRDYRVIAFDARGHGESDKPHDPKQYGANMAEDAIRLLDHLNIDRAHIIGYSMGSRLTGYLIVKFPERFATATLGASPPRRQWDEARAQRTVENIKQQGRQADSEDGQDYEALAAIPLSWASQVVSESELAGNTVPTLAIVGSEDDDENNKRLTKLRDLDGLMANYTLVVVEGATHSGEHGLMLRPEFVQEIRKFFALHALE